MWVDGDAPTPVVAAAAPAAAEPAAPAGPAKAPAGGSAGDATAARGRAFLILKVVVDVTGRAEAAEAGRR